MPPDMQAILVALGLIFILEPVSTERALILLLGFMRAILYPDKSEPSQIEYAEYSIAIKAKVERSGAFGVFVDLP